MLATDWAPDVDRDDRAQRASATALAIEALRVLVDRARSRCSRAAPWDLVLASDVLYEPRNGEALLPLLPRLIGRAGRSGSPTRAGRRRRAFLEPRAEDAFDVERRPARELPQGGVYRLRLRRVATISARVPGPPRRRRRCGIAPSKRSVSPSSSAWTVPSRSTSSAPRAT